MTGDAGTHASAVWCSIASLSSAAALQSSLVESHTALHFSPCIARSSVCFSVAWPAAISLASSARQSRSACVVEPSSATVTWSSGCTVAASAGCHRESFIPRTKLSLGTCVAAAASLFCLDVCCWRTMSACRSWADSMRAFSKSTGCRLSPTLDFWSMLFSCFCSCSYAQKCYG